MGTAMDGLLSVRSVFWGGVGGVGVGFPKSFHGESQKWYLSDLMAY